MKRSTRDEALLADYVSAFTRLDNTTRPSVPAELRVGTDEHGELLWQPGRYTTPVSALDALYRGMGFSGEGSCRFPRLYERLVVSYRWMEVDLGIYRLLANPPADDLSPLQAAMCNDKHLFEVLASNGFVQFGMGPDLDYDPICFDFRNRRQGGDCRVVKLDHEVILCHGRIRETGELAPSFRSLVMDTIRMAGGKHV